jgi:FKBP-type peptidyl-prolyl cis-trans isomerase
MKRWNIVVAAVLLTASGYAVQAAKAPAAPTKVAASKFKTLPGGLKYVILKPGKGTTAVHGDIDVHYTGWLKSNGKKFDSSFGKKPFKFHLGDGEVIKGWDQGVKGMKTGEKRQLIVPPALGYGANGSPDGSIPANSTLVFEIELLKVYPHD